LPFPFNQLSYLYFSNLHKASFTLDFRSVVDLWGGGGDRIKIRCNSRSVNSMFSTLNMFKNVKNIEITDLELCLMDNLHVRLNFNLSKEKGIKHNS
jgi:hypothetical protein